MNLLRLLGAASSAIVLLAGCNSPAPLETVASGGAGGGGSVSSSDSSGSGGPGSGWVAAPDHAFGALALASSGNVGALAYVESTAWDSAAPVESIIKLQRLDAGGARVGAAIELGHVSSAAPSVTVASDGAHYLACWDDPSSAQISCALAPVAEGPSLPGLSVAGLWPSLVHSAGAWTLAYGVPGHVALAHITDDGGTLGATALFAVDQAIPPRALLAARPKGFALVSAPGFDSGQDVFVHLLDSGFTPLGAPIDLGMKLWLRNAAAIVVNGARIAVSVSEPYDSREFLITGGVITSTHIIDGGGKVGPTPALTADGAWFGRIALDSSPEALTYTTIEGDALTAMPQQPEADHALTFYDSQFAVLSIGGNQLFASTAGSHNEELIVAGVQRP